MKEDPLIVKPGEQAVIISRENAVIYSDYESVTGSRVDLHLLDVIDAKHQDILRVLGVAMERPGTLVESEVIFRSEKKHLRVFHQPDYRTHIIFSPPHPPESKKWTIQKPQR